MEKHNQTGGIVPEVAARDSAEQILPAITKAMNGFQGDMADIDAIAVTAGPGLMGSLLVGIETARSLAYIHNKPLIPIHHISGHICANRLLRKEPPDFPVLVLTVSGGHNEIILWENDFDFKKLGHTLDDSAGEAFDKVARLLGLGFPGGPAIAELAKDGYEKAFQFPKPMLQSKDFDFSFSGLKTAVLYQIRDLGGLENMNHTTRADVAASFQEAVTETLSRKLLQAVEKYRSVREIHLSGGVSANQKLREKIFLWSEKLQLEFHFPEKLEFCTDNAAMIAGAGYWKYKKFPEKDWKWQDVQPMMGHDFF